MYHRHRAGKGFKYLDDQGNLIRDKEVKDYIRSLVIPPAWKEVEISQKKNARILATGRDERGRKQYIYNPKFRQRQNQKKFDRILHFAEQLPRMRRVTGQHLRKRSPCREKVLAAMVRLLDTAFFRPGSEAYAKQNHSYGLTTLRSKHLSIDGDTLIFRFRGKSGVAHEKQVEDRRLAKIVQELDELPGYEIFKFVNDDGRVEDVKSEHLNAYIREVMGEEFSAKDFRTWAGTVIAAMALDELEATAPESQAKLNKNIRAAVIKVSESLGNTPAVARDAYIDPRIIEEYIDGRTLRYFSKEVNRLLKAEDLLSDAETAVLCMLRSRLKAR